MVEKNTSVVPAFKGVLYSFVMKLWDHNTLPFKIFSRNHFKDR